MARGPRAAVLASVGVIIAAALVGAIRLWPSGNPVTPVTSSYAAPGVTFPRATVIATLPPCPPPPVGAAGSVTGEPSPAAGSTGACGKATVSVDGAAGEGDPPVTVDVPTEALRAGLGSGDRIVLLRLPDEAVQQAQAQGGALSTPYSFAGVERASPIGIVVALFVVLVGVVGRWRGVAAMVGLVFSGLVLLRFVAPALLEGHDPVAVAVVSSVLIMAVVLYLTHGLSLRTSTAFVGTVFGVVIMALAGSAAVGATRLTGVSDDDGGTLQALAGSVDLHALVAASVIIGGLGALNDITITQTSAVWELSAAGGDMRRRELFGSGMRIGRDHLASTIYTIAFAYAGTAMPVLLLLALFDRPWADVLTSEDISTEVVRTVASSFGLILAVPLTTAIAVAVATSGHQPARDPGPLAQGGSGSELGEPQPAGS